MAVTPCPGACTHCQAFGFDRQRPRLFHQEILCGEILSGQSINTEGKSVVVQMGLAQKEWERLSEIGGSTWVVALASDDTRIAGRLEELRSRGSVEKVVLLWSEELEVAKILEKIPPDLQPRTVLQWALPEGSRALQISVLQQWVESVRRLQQDFSWLSWKSQPWDTLNTSRLEDGDLFCEPEEVLWAIEKSTNPKISVIIPSYGRAEILKQVLKSLDVAARKFTDFEVVLVDDGSAEHLRNSLRQDLRQVSFSVCHVRLPARRQPRADGSQIFRAGMARNWGVKVSRAPYLLFLDSDVCVGDELLPAMVKGFDRGSDVLQAKRHHSERAGDADPIWQWFQTQTSEWNQIPAGWKFVSTFCLGFRRELFEKLGGFRWSYSRYGFEDTDLGFRAWQEKARFEMLDQDVWHVGPPKNPIVRKAALEAAAPLFATNNMAPETFSALSGFLMLQKPSWRERLPWLLGEVHESI